MPFGASLVLTSAGGDAPAMRTEITLYDEIARVDIANAVTKAPVDCSDSIYQAFPLGTSEEPVVYLEVAGAVMRPGTDQVPGTATDWHGVQDYFAVASGDHTTIVATPDVPLVQVNGINTGLWQETLPPHNGLVMSWVMNNYWFTNFPAAQGGTVHYDYSVASHEGAFEAERASRFAASIRKPLQALVSTP